MPFAFSIWIPQALVSPYTNALQGPALYSVLYKQRHISVCGDVCHGGLPHAGTLTPHCEGTSVVLRDVDAYFCSPHFFPFLPILTLPWGARCLKINLLKKLLQVRGRERSRASGKMMLSLWGWQIPGMRAIGANGAPWPWLPGSWQGWEAQGACWLLSGDVTPVLQLRAGLASCLRPGLSVTSSVAVKCVCGPFRESHLWLQPRTGGVGGGALVP